MRSRLPLIASVLLSGTGIAACQLALGIDGLTGGAGGSASSTGSSKPATSSTTSSGAGASTSSQTSTSSSGGGSTPSTTSATTTSSSSSGEPDSGYHTCTPLVGAYPDETCTGLFVSSSLGTMAGPGTMAAPYSTIGAALASSTEPLTIYVCGENFNETVSGTGNVTMYGGLDCQNDWQYTANQTKLTGATGAPIVSFTTGPTVIENFAIAANTSTMMGGSSIGMAFGGTSLTLTNVSITAAAGSPGANGAAPSTLANPGPPGNPPASGTTCTGLSITGGLPGFNSCKHANSGGLGGSGQATVSAGDGSPGQPGSAGAAPDGGAGQIGTTACTVGTPGTTAANGNPGIPATGIGTLTLAGYTGPIASQGTPGGDGPGGGGGGGAVGCATDGGAGPGGAGGGGGAGGCGGLAGDVGTPGGSSIGLLLSASAVPTLTFAGVTIAVASGGNGGAGVAGQSGGKGGLPGLGSGNGCEGGSGGNGGNGGDAPGGAGGHSIAIALTTATVSPAPTGIKTVTLGQRGTGGAGSDMMQGPKGPDGLACTVMSFAGSPAAHAACTVQ